jgi:hypothetical protein
MTASFTVQGANLKITFTYTAPLAQMTDIATAAAHKLYDQMNFIPGNGTPSKPFADLTDAEKLALLDARIVQDFTQLAKQYYIDSTVQAANVAAVNKANTDYTLP